MSKFLYLIFIFFNMTSCDSIATEKPSRQECIIRIDIKWELDNKFNPMVKNHKIQDMLNLFMSNYESDFGVKAIKPSYSIQGNESEKIYVQFADFCNEKSAITKRIFSKVSSKLKASPNYFISNDVIAPERKTIRVTGIYWSDK